MRQIENFCCSFLYWWSAFIILSMKAFVPLLGMHKERHQCRLIHTWGAIIGLFWLFFLVFFLVFFLASLVFCDLHVAFCSSFVFEEHQFKQHQWIVIYWFITINMLLLKCLACSSSVIFGVLEEADSVLIVWPSCQVKWLSKETWTHSANSYMKK